MYMYPANTNSQLGFCSLIFVRGLDDDIVRATQYVAAIRSPVFTIKAPGTGGAGYTKMPLEWVLHEVYATDVASGVGMPPIQRHACTSAVIQSHSYALTMRSCGDRL